jgi:hypothetical protein
MFCSLGSTTTSKIAAVLPKEQNIQPLLQKMQALLTVTVCFALWAAWQQSFCLFVDYTKSKTHKYFLCRLHFWDDMSQMEIQIYKECSFIWFGTHKHRPIIVSSILSLWLL